MPENPAQVDLSWFYTLKLNDQVALLSNPHQLSQQLADHLKQIVSLGWWNSHPTDPVLDALVLQRLEQIRSQLDEWWWDLLTGEPLPDNERNHLIKHRTDDEPPQRYLDLVQNEANAIGERPAMVHAYIEMQARRLDQA
jgi:hypothetical protein